jgi:hypothetical protein
MLSIIGSLTYELLILGKGTQEGDILPADALALHVPQLINIEVADEITCGGGVDLEQFQITPHWLSPHDLVVVLYACDIEWHWMSFRSLLWQLPPIS